MSKTNLGKVCITPRGAWAALTAYRVLDVVTYGGGSYLALHDLVAGIAPTDTNAWLCIAEKGAKGDTGATGKGIASVAKTGSAGLVDTYTITFTDGTTTTYTVTNGEKGDTGEEGNGIESIEKTSTVGAVDTYTITFTDGTTTTYTVTNGAVTSVDGKTGAVTLDNKAEVDGYYERMAVGRADNLVDRKDQGTEQSFGFRTACGDVSITDDGTAVVKEIRGKTLVWNQLVNRNRFPSTDTESGVTFTNNADGTVNVSGTATEDVYFELDYELTMPKGKILLRGCPSGGNATNGFYLFLGNVGNDTGSGIITELSEQKSGALRICVKSGETVPNLRFAPQVYNLTKMFGAGKEPATVSEFYVLFPLIYPRNVGTLLSLNSDAIETVGFNQYDHSTGTAELLGGNQYQITGAYDELILSNGEKLTNKYARIPFIGTATASTGSNGSGNYDKFLRVKNPKIAYNIQGGGVILEAKYRPHFVELSKDSEAANYCGYQYSGSSDAIPTVDAQFLKNIGGELKYISLYTINLKDGTLDFKSGTNVAGAQPLTLDKWNTIKVVIDLAAGTYATYVNGLIYANCRISDGTNTYTNMVFDGTEYNPNGMLLIAKCNKNTGTYLAPSLVSGRDYSYCDVDDIVLKDASGETILAEENFENRTSVNSAGGNYEYSSVEKETDTDENGQFTPSQTGTLTVTGGNDTDTCVHLVWSGYRNGEWEPYRKNTLTIPEIQDHSGNVLFPDGLCRIGNSCDSISADHAVRKIGIVDLGELTWRAVGLLTAKIYIASAPNSIIPQTSEARLAGFLSDSYPVSTTGKTSIADSDTVMDNKSIIRYSDGFAVRDDDYATLEAFEEAIQNKGLYVYYELATPVTVTFDNDPVTGSANIHEPLNLTYPVADFGTEKVKGWGEVDTNGVPKTTPIDAVISYSTDFTREIATLPKNYISVDSLESFAAALGYTMTKSWDETNKRYDFTLTPAAEQQAEE